MLDINLSVEQTQRSIQSVTFIPALSLLASQNGKQPSEAAGWQRSILKKLRREMFSACQSTIGPIIFGFLVSGSSFGRVTSKTRPRQTFTWSLQAACCSEKYIIVRYFISDQSQHQKTLTVAGPMICFISTTSSIRTLFQLQCVFST